MTVREITAVPFALALLCATTLAAAAGEIGPKEVAFVDYAVPEPLTGEAGDPAEGRKVFADRKLGNCLACHQNSEMSEQLFHGEVGPPLDGVASRWSPEQLRAIVVNSKEVFGPDTVMPAFYSLEVGKHVREDLVGKTILSAAEVEAVVAYLATLK